MSFYVSISDAVFLVTSFSIFDQSVWLILSFWCAHFYPFIDFYWSSGRCTSEFALECFCLNKVITNWLVVSTSFWSWLLNVLQFWHLWNRERRFFLMRCGYAEDSWEFWILILVFVFLKYFFFCVHLWCDFLWYNFFHFSGQCVASEEILMC